MCRRPLRFLPGEWKAATELLFSSDGHRSSTKPKAPSNCRGPRCPSLLSAPSISCHAHSIFRPKAAPFSTTQGLRHLAGLLSPTEGFDGLRECQFVTLQF